MSSLPTQLPWRRFVCVLRKLGYTAQKGRAGSARSFSNRESSEPAYVDGPVVKIETELAKQTSSLVH
jgi:hypothetical protein